ncbi:DUF1905 domain-containing protein [Flavobacterium sp.]|uniref:DUF1905 domain-containing protein n=1 Tax=Flavobacterium sp. TaxID=239 RepID=UPI003B9C11A1
MSRYMLQKFDSGMHYILVPDAVVAAIRKNGNTRAICTLNKAETFHCALLPKKEGGYFVNVGSKICKKLKIGVGSEVEATFEIDQSEIQFAVPEEWTAVLTTDEEAKQIFERLSLGNQRGLLHLIDQVKSTEKRVERALKIAEKLKMGITSPRIILK